MNDSTDTKDIDSYGVWVKRPPQDSPDKEKSLDELLDTGDFDSISTFPDFSEPDAQADTKIDDKADDFSNAASEDSLDFDTTLTVDELSNISDTTGIAEDEPAVDTSADSLVADDFFPDFDDSGTGGEDKTTEVSADSFGDEDISLDDFMTEDSTDPNPPAAPETPDSGTSTADDDGEISLDDFLDDASFGGDDSQKEDDVSNDAPLDIDLNFNESPSEQVEVEDAPEEDDDIEIKDEEFDDMFDKISSSGQDNSGLSDSAATSEEVSLDDFNTDSNVGNAEKDSNDSEDVDLSAFGIDSDADETPVTSNVQESKKVEVVDYDLSISDDAETTAAPKVAIVQDSSPEPVNKEETENVSTQLLKQIVADLSGLKSEINTLKSEFEELKTRDFSETQSRSKNTEPDVIEVPEEEENTGFFSGRDEDETIALSGDELNNIMQTADFSDDELAMPESSDEVVEDSPEESGSQTDSFDIPEESAVQEKTEDSFTDFTDTAEADTENSSSVEDLSKTQPAEQTEETVINEDKTLDGADTLTQDSTEESFTEPATIEEPDVVDESEHFTDDEPFSAITEDEIVIPEEEHDSGLSLDVESETLEEPDLNDIDTMNIPQEISIPKVDDVGETEETSDETKVDDILVESSSTDLMNSVKESTLESTAEDIVEPVEETSVSEEVENIEDDDDKTEEDPAVTTNGSSDPLFDEIMAEEPSISETLSKESVDYLAEEEIVKDNPQTQENPSEESDEETPESTDIPSDLKSDIKSVLLYMDQLLENLPEEKIMEFAKSEQFVTYKKLFAELGLS
ncbi:MAG: hypothetical protein ACTTJ1_00395 [Treponema sp.]